jgi:hypothetical protein
MKYEVMNIGRILSKWITMRVQTQAKDILERDGRMADKRQSIRIVN